MKIFFGSFWLQQLGLVLIITEICLGFHKQVLKNLFTTKSSSSSYFEGRNELRNSYYFPPQQRLFSSQSSSSSITITNNTFGYHKNGIHGADNVIVIQDEQTKQTKYIPKPWSNINSINSNSDVILESASPEDMWKWLQEKKILEKELKSAIASNLTDIEIQEEYFSKYEPYLALEQSDILQKNHYFFQALNKGDTNSLRSLWYDSNDAICIQADTNAIITGYRNIINWLTHSSNELPRLYHQAKNITLNYFGDVAIVTCIVDISTNKNENNNGVISKKKNSSGSNNKMKSSRKSINQPYFCTNIFVQPADTDTYLLSAHIASPKYTFDSKEAKKARSSNYQDPTARSKKKDGSVGSGSLLADGSRLMSVQKMFNAQNRGINIFEAAVEEDEEEDDDEDDEEDDDDDDDDIVGSNTDDDDDDESSDGEDGDNDDDDDDDTPSKKNTNNNKNNKDNTPRGLTAQRAQALRTALTNALIKLGIAPPSSLNNGKNGGLPKNVMIIDAKKLGKLNGLTGSSGIGLNNAGIGGMKSVIGEKILKAIKDNMMKNGISGGIVDITEEIADDDDDDDDYDDDDDEEDSEDEDDEDDDDGKKKKKKSKTNDNKKSSSTGSINIINSNGEGIVPNGKGFGAVKKGSGSSNNKGVSKKSSSKYLVQDYVVVDDDDDDDEEDDDDYDDDNDEDEDADDDYTSDADNEEAATKVAKNLASTTLKAIKYLHTHNRLTSTEKSLLVSDVINKNAVSEFSKVEIAFSVCIGPGRPQDLLSAVSLSADDFSHEPDKSVRQYLYQKYREAQKQSSGLSSVEVELIEEDVMSEFEEMCHALVLDLLESNE